MNNNLRTDLIVEILPKNKTNKVDDIEITRVHLNSKDEFKLEVKLNDSILYNYKYKKKHLTS